MMIAAAAMAACTSIVPEPDAGPQAAVPVRVEMRISTETPATVTRTVNAYTISDVNLYLFGEKDYHFYFTQPAAYTAPIAFDALPGSYKLYAVANVHKDMGALTEKDLHFLQVATQDMNAHDDIPMSAKVRAEINGSGLSQPNVTVERIAAKVEYEIAVADKVAAEIGLVSVSFCSQPRSTFVYGGEGIYSTDPKEFFDGQPIASANPQKMSGVAYLPENRQGTVPDITDQREKSPDNAPRCATYMRILAEGAGGEVIEYIVYLGRNNTDDFEVIRNTIYRMNIVILGRNEIDSRVRVYSGIYYGKANSVVCPGYQVSFDVTPYRTSKSIHFAYTGFYAGKEYEAVSARVIWQGTANLIAAVYLKDNMLTVSTNGRKGNAVVAICDAAGEILWSFHIWCTAGDGPRDVLCENYAKARFYMMDRNLGAFANQPASYTDAGGLCYQWGRKDPFPNTNEDYVYTPTGAGTFIEKFPKKEFHDKAERPSFDDYLLLGVRNPATFMQVKYGTLWYDDSPHLWGDPEGYKQEYNASTYSWSAEKSVFDPCPEGYRVGNKYTWTGFSKDGATKIGDNNFGKTLTSAEINIIGAWGYGWLLRMTPDDTKGCYVPATQCRNLGGKLTADNLNAVKETNFYWSSTVGFDGRVEVEPEGGNVFIYQSNQLLLNVNYFGTSSVYDPGFGFAVRCVRI